VAPLIVVTAELKSAVDDDCHSYVIGLAPLASTVEVNVAGVKAPQFAWLVAMVPGSITVTVTVAVFTQPVVVAVPVTIYVVVLSGVAITVAVLVADNPVDGLQL
jgi:hypothetical protein